MCIQHPRNGRPVSRITPSRPAALLRACGTVAFLLAGTGSAAQADPPAPNFTGVWGHDGFNYRKPYATPAGGVAGGYANPLLMPWVVELLMRDALVARSSGRSNVTDHTICYPEGIPAEFGGREMQILQTPSEIDMLFGDTNHSRTIRLNRPHSAHATPSWFGDSVGHFEGDSLVIDTIDIEANPKIVASSYGTPHTDALHVVERYRFLSANETPIAGLRGTANAFNDGQLDRQAIVPGGKTLRLTFTVEEPGAYRKPWSVTLDYRQLNTRIREFVCAENNDADLLLLMPTAAIPDF